MLVSLIFLSPLLSALPACVENQVSTTESEEELIPILSISPRELFFNDAQIGVSQVSEFALTNIGNVALEVYGVGLESPSSAFDVDTSGGVIFSLAPEESRTFEVSFTPQAPSNLARVKVESNDPAQTEAYIELIGGGLLPELTISPNPLDFGEIPPGCSLDRTATLTNTGLAPLALSSFFLSGGSDFEADHDTITVPLTLQPGESRTLNARYTAAQFDSAEAILEINTNEPVGRRVLQLLGSGGGDGTYRDEFIQADGPWEKTDVLFYIDRSCSMEDDTANLAANFGAFLSVMEAWEMDYQIGVTTLNSGSLNSGQGTTIITPLTINKNAVFTEMANGPAGTNTEAGLSIIREAVVTSSGFFREDSKPNIIMVSDEPEQSLGGWEAQVDEIVDIIPNVVLSAVAGDVPDGCPTAGPGFGYYEATLSTNGYFFSICDIDWGRQLQLIAALSGGPIDAFILSNEPDPDTLLVTVDGSVVSTGWAFDPSRNAVVFEAGSLPPARSRIEVLYSRVDACL